jgi:EpsI family protein
MKQITSKAIRFWFLLIVLLVSAGVTNLWERAGEASVSRKELKDFPSQIGDWRQQGTDLRFDPETEKVLRAHDYVSRNFESNGRLASLYVGYYATQKTGATYHSPLNCLPGSGWVMSDGGKVSIPSPSGSTFEANRYVIQNGNHRALMIYWYHGRGKAVASEYWAKIDTVLDSVRRRRSDGALVRVMVPVSGSLLEAEQSALEFASQTAKELSPFVPN